jgi:hypothetical protein
MTINVGEIGMQEPYIRLNTVWLGHWLRKSKMISNGDPAFRLARPCDVTNKMKTTASDQRITVMPKFRRHHPDGGTM